MTKIKKATQTIRPGSGILKSIIEEGDHVGAPTEYLYCHKPIATGDPCCTVHRKGSTKRHLFCSRDHQQEKEYAVLKEYGFFDDLPLTA